MPLAIELVEELGAVVYRNEQDAKCAGRLAMHLQVAWEACGDKSSCSRRVGSTTDTWSPIYRLANIGSAGVLKCALEAANEGGPRGRVRGGNIQHLVREAKEAKRLR